MDGRRDLQLSDSFHRVKRTALLLSCALLVTFIDGIEIVEGAITGLSFASVEIDFVRTLLWISATYYLVGSLLEFIQEQQAHAGALDAPRLRAVEAVAESIRVEMIDAASACSALVKETQKQTEALPQLVQAAVQAQVTREMLATALSAVTSIERSEGQSLRDRPSTRNMIIEQAALRTAGLPVDQFTQDILQALEGQNQSLTTARIGLDELAQRTGSWQTELRSLRVRMFSVRWLYFFGWELGGVIVPWLMATILFWSQSSAAKVTAAIAAMFN